MEWIPVEEKLPECLDRIEDNVFHSKAVLVCDSEQPKRRARISYLRKDNLFKNGFLVFTQREMTYKWGLSGSENVTHWMPLPEPPKQ